MAVGHFLWPTGATEKHVVPSGLRPKIRQTETKETQNPHTNPIIYYIEHTHTWGNLFEHCVAVIMNRTAGIHTQAMALFATLTRVNKEVKPGAKR